ncbi:hypothetical protein B0H66DRAFT_605585 [Apodospora peruviana]|uniref:Uncharacterized protein n=1 Tax=Apodospora peruviana TaxID=516989 RepID=A0AAE0HY26_9PEZI|nr:hypothetical protein B0H66DRAFT_605585 [Apodospora peruviana]
MRFISDDRKKPPQNVATKMQVLALGLPRCATSSMQAALESDILNHGPVIKLFDWYGATSDFPGCTFAADLMNMYPEAAIILNQRKDGRVWIESVNGSIRFLGKPPYLVTCYLWQTDCLLYRIQWTLHRTSVVGKFGLDSFYSSE